MTLALVMANIIVYHHSAGSFLTSPLNEEIVKWGLVGGRHLSLLSYQFLHLWSAHLIVNTFLLFVFGLMVERTLGPGKLLTIYLSGGVVGGMAHLLLEPTLLVSGASASVWAVIGAALVIEPLLSLVAFMVSSLFLIPLAIRPTIDFAKQHFESSTQLALDSSLSEKDTALEAALAGHEKVTDLSLAESSAEAALAEGEMELETLATALASGDISQEDYDSQLPVVESGLAERQSQLETISEEKSAAESELDAKKTELSEKIETSKALQSELTALKFSSELEARTVTAKASHMAGLLTGYLMMIFLEPMAFEKWKRYFTHLGRV